MSRKHRLLLAAQVLLGIGVVIFGVRVAAHYRTARIELGRTKLSALTPETRAKLENLEGDCLITYYVSGRGSMPSHLRRLERSVTDVLEACSVASGGLLRYQIVDPEAQPEFVSYTANQRVAPFRVRSVQKDSYSEETIWSTLTINYAAYPQALIHGVLPDHLPRLQTLLREHLTEMEAPRKPRIALGSSHPDDYDELAADLERRNSVIRFDPASEPIPADTDLFLWISPGAIAPEQVTGLTQYLERGGSAIVAGSEVRPNRTGPPSSYELRVEPTGYDAEPLLAAFGLRPTRALVLDKRCDSVPVGEIAVQLPFALNCIAPNQDFHTLEAQPNGHLLFETPTPIELDGDLAAELGWRPEVLATSSRFTWVQALPFDEPLPAAELVERNGLHVPKQALITLLRPVDPWKGTVAFFASASCFADGNYRRESYAHQMLSDVLVGTLASGERIVLRHADIHGAEPLPELTTAARLFWRIACVLALPALLAIRFLRGLRSGDGIRTRPKILRHWRHLVKPAALLAVALGIVAIVAQLGARADLTADGLNGLAPLTQSVAADADSTRIELWASSRHRLPPNMRAGWRRTGDVARELARFGDIQVVARDPADLDADEHAALESYGVEPLRVRSDDEERTTVRTIYSTVRVVRGEASRVIQLASADAFEAVELKLAFALWQLQNDRTPHVAFVSDLPRLSPAEAHEDYQLKGKFAPSGTDVYSSARSALRDLGFQVTHVRQDAPELPDDIDLLIWMQPRRDVGAMLEVMTKYLHEGGRVLVAGQYFNIQPRQYRGRDFETVYWPQPQTPDTERFYYGDIGLELVWGVLFDDLKTRLTVETHVNRDATQRDYEEQESALPFLIRASAGNFNTQSPIVRGLGDQAFVWGSQLRVDEERLAENGLRAEVLMTTSAESWRFPWTGGYLPPEVLSGPLDYERTDQTYRGSPKLVPATDDTPADRRVPAERLGKVPLAVHLRGTFPAWVDLRGSDENSGGGAESSAPPAGPLIRDGGAPGELVFVGCSEMFKNDRLFEPEFRSDHLLTNAACLLGVGPELAQVATQRRIAPGFDYVAPDSKLFWRAAVLGVGPLLMLVFGLIRVAGRRAPVALKLPDGQLASEPDGSKESLT